jgi:hypothetical protein
MRVITKAISQFADESGKSLTTVADYANGVFTGYVTALLWSESCRGTMPECDHAGMVGEQAQDCDRGLDSEYNECDLTGAATESIWADVSDFVVSNWDDLYGNEDEVDEDDPEAPAVVKQMDPEQAGHDFLLTRNHHGAGFWDRGLGERGDRLTANAHPYGNTLAYATEDGMVEVEG